MSKSLVPTFFLLLTSAISAAASSISFPSGFVPFTSIIYESGPDQNGYSLVEGTGTIPTASDGFQSLAAYLFSLPAISANELYANQPIQLAPGQFFSNVLIPTASETQGNFQDFDLPLFDPIYDAPFVSDIIPTSQLFDEFAFRLGPDISAAPEPAGLALVGLGLLGCACFALRSAFKP